MPIMASRKKRPGKNDYLLLSRSLCPWRVDVDGYAGTISSLRNEARLDHRGKCLRSPMTSDSLLQHPIVRLAQSSTEHEGGAIIEEPCVRGE